jgi:2,3-dihydroxyphenylpropionate 1,2-dioxygenase
MMFVPEVAEVPAAKGYRAALETVSSHLRAAAPDALVLFYPDHFRQFRLDNMPTFSLGLKRIRTLGDWYLPKAEYAVDEVLALPLLRGLIDRGFDVAFRLEVLMDHGGAQPLQVLDVGSLPILPIAINSVAPPLPTLRRCFALGQAISEVLTEVCGSAKRIAVIGSGGLSHAVPMARWEELDPSDARWPVYVSGVPDEQLEAIERGRVASVVAAVGTPQVLVNQPFDRQVMEWIEDGAVEQFLDLDPQELPRQGGNGMNEVRNWVAAWGCLRGARAVTLYYQGIPEWLTGMGVMEFIL